MIILVPPRFTAMPRNLSLAIFIEPLLGCSLIELNAMRGKDYQGVLLRQFDTAEKWILVWKLASVWPLQTTPLNLIQQSEQNFHQYGLTYRVSNPGGVQCD